MDFLQDTALPQFFTNPTTKVSCEVHMDDIHGCGSSAANSTFIDQVGQMLNLKKAGRFGPGESYEHLKRVRHLYREGRLIVPNSKYVKTVATALGLESGKAAKTPEVDSERRVQDDNLDLLDDEWASTYRSHACTLMYAGHDVAEAQHGIRELTTELKEPSVASWTRLKRVTRYMKGVQDEGVWFPKAGDTSELLISTDTDWAGCRATRKSCACYTIQCGGCLLNVTSTGQSIHAQSSGESEFYGNVSGISAGVCVRHILKFFGFETQIVLASDSSAARAVLARAG